MANQNTPDLHTENADSSGLDTVARIFSKRVDICDKIPITNPDAVTVEDWGLFTWKFPDYIKQGWRKDKSAG